MEPLMPSPIPEKLQELALEVIRQAAGLGLMLHPITRLSLAESFREMNSFYSNLIEGHNTSPLDIQRALNQDYSKDPAKRILQQESVAHIEVEKLLEQRLSLEPTLEICTLDFLCWIHKEFYDRLPEALKIVSRANGQQETIIPGALRIHEVEVGHHVAPQSNFLGSFLNRFSEVYEPCKLNSIHQIIAAAASHHRLAWIHPFLDGNGRVIRLFSEAYFIKAKIDANHLWSISRGLARNRSQYMEALALADSARQGDLDGRGNLSQKGLISFCEFFLETAIDQITFIQNSLDPSKFKKRMERYIHYLVDEKLIKPEAIYLLEAALFQGEILRGEVAHLCGLSERSARTVLKQCLDRKLLVSSTPKGPVRLAFPIEAVEFYFPTLYPEK